MVDFNYYSGVSNMHDCSKEKDIAEIKESLKHVEKMLKGNGIIGIAEMARRAFDRTEVMKTSKNGLMDWAFRTLIGLLMVYIATRVGLRQ